MVITTMTAVTAGINADNNEDNTAAAAPNVTNYNNDPLTTTTRDQDPKHKHLCYLGFQFLLAPVTPWVILGPHAWKPYLCSWA
jgi:hypothetical protein